jgi:hypothetical protein
MTEDGDRDSGPAYLDFDRGGAGGATTERPLRCMLLSHYQFTRTISTVLARLPIISLGAASCFQPSTLARSFGTGPSRPDPTLPTSSGLHRHRSSSSADNYRQMRRSALLSQT